MTKNQQIAAIAITTLAVVIIALLVLAHRGSVDTSTAVAASTATAGAVAVAAAKLRSVASEDVAKAEERVEGAKGDLEKVKAEDQQASNAVESEVKDLSRDAKEKLGEELFKPGSGT